MVRNKSVLSRKMELNTVFDTSNTRDIVFSQVEERKISSHNVQE